MRERSYSQESDNGALRNPKTRQEGELAMTLLITLARESVIHQSSDYRLSDRGRVTATANGTKQLRASARQWTAFIAFAGIATDGRGYSTREWLHDEGMSLAPASDPEAFVEKLARRGTEELRKVTNYDHRLSIIVVVASVGRCRLFMVSNFEEHGKNPLSTALDTLRVDKLDLSSPILLVNGAGEALPRWEKKQLRKMFRSAPDPKAMRERMARANQVAASQKAYVHKISPGCWVTTIFEDGHWNGENYAPVSSKGARGRPTWHGNSSRTGRSLSRRPPEEPRAHRWSVTGRSFPTPPA
jgi:hypothetical protein